MPMLFRDKAPGLLCLKAFERLDKADFSQMSLDLASHGWGETSLLDGIFAIEPACRTISGFAVAPEVGW